MSFAEDIEGDFDHGTEVDLVDDIKPQASYHTYRTSSPSL